MRRIEDVKKGLACHAQGRNRLLDCSDCAYHGPGLPHCSKAVHEDSLALIEQMEAQVPKWFNIRDCLPGLHEKVLFTPMCNEGAIYIGTLNAVGTYGAAYFAVRDGKRKTCYSATHWMPLPEPPKEDDHAQTD